METDMPAYTKKFQENKYTEEVILDNNNKVIGTIRIKPVGILWKPKNKGKFFSMRLDDFTKWISDPKTKALRTGS